MAAAESDSEISGVPFQVDYGEGQFRNGLILEEQTGFRGCLEQIPGFVTILEAFKSDPASGSVAVMFPFPAVFIRYSGICRHLPRFRVQRVHRDAYQAQRSVSG